MTKPNLILFAAAGLAIAGPCKPGSSLVRTSEVSISYSVTRSSMETITTSTVEISSASTTDTTRLTNEETTTITSTQTTPDTTLDTTSFYTETASLSTKLLADPTIITTASLSSSETLSAPAATTSAAADGPYECIGSIRIQHDHYAAIRGGYLGPQTWNDCAQLCEDNPSCYAFSHNSANSCWNAAAGDVVSQVESQGWTSGIKGTCPQDL